MKRLSGLRNPGAGIVLPELFASFRRSGPCLEGGGLRIVILPAAAQGIHSTIPVSGWVARHEANSAQERTPSRSTAM